MHEKIFFKFLLVVISNFINCIISKYTFIWFLNIFSPNVVSRLPDFFKFLLFFLSTFKLFIFSTWSFPLFMMVKLLLLLLRLFCGRSCPWSLYPSSFTLKRWHYPCVITLGLLVWILFINERNLILTWFWVSFYFSIGHIYFINKHIISTILF